MKYLSPRSAKILSPICTMVEPSVEYYPFPQSPEPVYDPYSHSSSNQRTRNQFRPRNTTKGSSSYQLRQYAEATLGGGSLRKTVKLPEGEDENEWLACNSECYYYLLEETMLIRYKHSGRFLQSYQSSLWFYHGILLSANLPRNESYR